MKKIQKLRNKIAARTLELGITPVWDDRGHHYKFPDGPEYPSVTKKLQVIKDEGLMNWKMNRAITYVKDMYDKRMNGPEEGRAIYHKEVIEWLDQAKLVPTQEFEGAGDIGSTVHNWREQWFNRWISFGFNEGFPEIVDERLEVLSACRGIINCINQLDAEPLACELSLAHDKLRVGGQLDDLWLVNGEVWLIDLKTSNIGNKNSYYMQVAAYWYMFRKLYKIKVDKLFILHVSKTIFGKYELIELKHPKRYWEMAKSAFKLSDDLLELEDLKKPEVTKI